MPDFQWVKAPVFQPTACMSCMTHSHRDGFVDLLSEDVNGMHHYLCAGCAFTAAQKLGCLSPAQADDLRRRLADAAEELLGVQSELEAERENKVVPLADVKAMLRNGRQTGSKAPATA